MSLEQGSGGVSVERTAWRGAGIVLAIEAVRLIASWPFPPVPEARAIEMMAEGLALPMWLIWGESRGWAREDIGKVLPFVNR